MIKYRVKGEFLSENGSLQNICSEYFIDEKNPFVARQKARNYFLNFIDLLLNDFEIDFEKTFKNDTIIHLESQSFRHTFNYGIALEFTFDEEEFYEIDYYGIFDNYKYDDVNIGLETEFDFYKENKFHYENSSIITYYNKGEFEAGETENEPSDYEILETSLDFSNKDKIFWWFSEEELQKFIKRRTEEIEVEKSLKFGENSFIEFKPSLLYNFKTKQASIGVKNIIAKVICSFLNANGGKILIGVNDKGEIQGLEYDFSLKNKENEYDFFRNEFDNLLFQFFDRNVYNFVKADFNTQYGKPFFEISVKPSDFPFFLLNKKDSSKEFYIRTITSSVAINDIEDIVKYCLTHWRKNDSR